MNKLSHLSVFHEAQQRGWVNTRSGKLVPPKPLGEQSKSFEFVSAGALMATPTPATELIAGLFETEVLGLLFAPPSVGKSFVSLSMSAAIATGSDWLERRTQQGAVFYLAGEGHAGLGRRFKAWEVHHGISLSDAPIFISKTPAALMNENSAQAVIEAIRALCSEHGRPRLIVIDTFARNMGGGDENSNADVGVFISHIDKMRAEIGCAVLLVHHSGHSATERARGASALLAAMDAAFRLEKSGSGITMTHVKSKESELNPPLALGLEQVALPGWLDANGEEMNSAVVVAGTTDAAIGAVRLSPSEQQALDIFLDAARMYGQLLIDGKLAGLKSEIWRQEYGAKFPSKKAGTIKTAFGRAREKLVEVGHLSLVEPDIYHLSGTASLLYNQKIVEVIRARYDPGTAAQ